MGRWPPVESLEDAEPLPCARRVGYDQPHCACLLARSIAEGRIQPPSDRTFVERTPHPNDVSRLAPLGLRRRPGLGCDDLGFPCRG